MIGASVVRSFGASVVGFFEGSVFRFPAVSGVALLHPPVKGKSRIKRAPGPTCRMSIAGRLVPKLQPIGQTQLLDGDFGAPGASVFRCFQGKTKQTSRKGRKGKKMGMRLLTGGSGGNRDAGRTGANKRV